MSTEIETPAKGKRGPRTKPRRDYKGETAALRERLLDVKMFVAVNIDVLESLDIAKTDPGQIEAFKRILARLEAQ